ncbi:MAG: sulfatase [Anaerolineae bacterium]|nr:sulfatase [Anaerolineae bacterium]
MRILHIDIDSLRPDHLGCYGYHRPTSPNIDRIAQQAVRFDNCYVSDSPCLPSRTALFSGRCGFHSGVVGHGGTAAQPFIEGPSRDFDDTFARTSWMSALRRQGYRTATVSSFGERHGAWHWYAGFNDVLNCGGHGNEIADSVTPLALEWLARNGHAENWFLHVNYWDAHLHFRTPPEFGNPFEDHSPPDWITQDYLDRSQDACGMRCAQEALGGGWGSEADINSYRDYPREPAQLRTLADIKQWMDGYDVAVRYIDQHIGYLLDSLDTMGVLEETAVIISADHGEHLGELDVWGGHHMADHWINRVPLIVRWPGLTAAPQVDAALHYQFDWAATLIELIGGVVPKNWDGRSFVDAFRTQQESGRPFLVLSHAAMTAQRAVRFDDWICLRTYHDGYKLLDPILLFNLRDDPHEQHNLADQRPDLVDQAMHDLADWHHHMLLTSTLDVDPLVTVLREGGPYHVRGKLPAYLKRLRATGRTHLADRLIERHPDEAG